MNNFNKIKEIFENNTLEDIAIYLSHETSDTCRFCALLHKYYCGMNCYEGIKEYLESEWQDCDNQ